MIRYAIAITLLCLASATGWCQSREASAAKRTSPGIQAGLRASGVSPAGLEVFVRAFKLEGEVEAWVRSPGTGWRHFKTYRMCAVSGLPGRKRIEGDGQIPEGVYRVAGFNDRSSHHMSMRIDYPNMADKFWSDSSRPGGEIYIHGGCVTVGCIPITDRSIEELYTLARMSSAPVQVHIFSIRFSSPKNWERLHTYAYVREDIDFQSQMRAVYDHFEVKRELPAVLVDTSGRYVVVR